LSRVFNESERNLKMTESLETQNITVYWKVIMIALHSQETRRFGSLSSAREFVDNYKKIQDADHKIFKVIEEEVE